jgi:hypothetical protein
MIEIEPIPKTQQFKFWNDGQSPKEQPNLQMLIN